MACVNTSLRGREILKLTTSLIWMAACLSERGFILMTVSAAQASYVQ